MKTAQFKTAGHAAASDSSPQKDVDESRFYMWRAVLAFALSDGLLTLEVQQQLKEAFAAVPFSRSQKAQLRADLYAPQDVRALYKQITAPADQKHFFLLAHELRRCKNTEKKSGHMPDARSRYSAGGQPFSDRARDPIFDIRI